MPKKNVHKNSWKVCQSKRQLHKKTKLAVIVLTLIFGLIILGQIINFGKMFFKPWGLNQEKINRNYRWDGNNNINLVVKDESIGILSLNPKDKTAFIINFPDNTLIDTAFGFGKWQIRSIYNLGQSEGNRGYELLEKSLGNLLGVPIDGMIEYKGDLTELDIRNIKTDLTLLELIRLKISLSQIRFDKIKNIDLLKMEILDKTRMNDGTEIYSSDPDKLDQILVFIDPLIQKEHLSIAVFNATDYPQLAQKAARMITNLGGNVIIISNAQNTYAKTKVTGQKGSTLTRLSQVFDLGCSKDPTCANISVPEMENSRAQINIVLGEDFRL